MRYSVAGKWHDERFTIEDDAGTQQFEVRRIYGLDGNSLSLRGPGSEELAAIRPRHSPTGFEITAGSDQPITVHHRGWFGKRYSIDTPAGEMSARVGDFSFKSYELMSFGTARATVSRPFVRQQRVTIDVADGEDTVSMIAVALAIEALRYDRRDTQSSIPYVHLVLRLIN